MKIIAISHQKGGVGKSSLTINLALCYAYDLKVAIIDTDPQGSLQGISEMITGVDFLPVEKYQGNNISKLKSLDYDLLLIDTPPYLTENLATIFSISDYVLVPSKVSYVDIMAVRATIKMIKETQTSNPTIKAGLVLNMVKTGSTINEEIGELIKDLDIELLETTIGDRVSFTRSMILNGIFETDDQKAKDEITNLAHEILLAMKA
jgi:chromosome partitioning protein